MIFATVGSQAPFDRLIRALDEWACLNRRSDVYAQIAATEYRPQAIRFIDFMEDHEFQRCMQEAEIVVAHAGMGSIITALELSKRIVVMPRRKHLRETRNEHQVATAIRFAAQGRVLVARNENELGATLDYALSLDPHIQTSTESCDRLISTLLSFLQKRPYELELETTSAGQEVHSTRAVTSTLVESHGPKPAKLTTNVVNRRH